MNWLQCKHLISSLNWLMMSNDLGEGREGLTSQFGFRIDRVDLFF